LEQQRNSAANCSTGSSAKCGATSDGNHGASFAFSPAKSLFANKAATSALKLLACTGIGAT
jgi:hypothetical protein